MNVPEFKIRGASLDDEKAVMKVFNYFVENSYAAYTEHSEGKEFFRRLWYISRGYPFYVAENKDGEIVGFALVHPYYGIGVFRRSVRITYFILPRYTRMGLGKRFLDLLTEACRKSSVDNIMASVSSRNQQSLEFHKKYGFVECGRFKDIGRKWGKSFDEIWLQLKVKP